MIEHPYGTTIFCDDIREELGAKISLIGCYGGNIQFHGTPPGTLPTFAALTTIYLPLSFSLKQIELTVVLFDGNQEHGIFSVKENVSEPSKPDRKVELDTKLKSFVVPMKWSPLHFFNDGWIGATGSLNGEIDLFLGRIRVLFPKS